MVSIKDIARATGVSASAVSVVLTGKAKERRISDDLAKRITEAAKKMGYQPNRAAVGLRTGKSKTIGLIVENISNDFFSSLAKTIEDEARKYGYNVVYCSTENDAAKGSEMIQMLANHIVDGYLITPAHGMEPDIERLLKQQKPVVLMDRYFENLPAPYVVVDNYSGMKEGMEYVIKKGFKKIGFITIDLDLLQIRDRERAYRDALRQYQLPVKKTGILRVKYNYSKEKSVAIIRDFLKAGKFEAVVFATNYLGIYGLQSIKELNLRIPGDLGVICFDGHAIFELHSPGITVIEQPINEIAKTAVHILLGELGGRKAASNAHVALPTKMIIRESV